MSVLSESRSSVPITGARSGYVIRRPAWGVASALAGLARFIDGGLEHLVDRMFSWQQRLADRRALASLDDRLLRDVGLTRADVHREASKPFWRP